MAINCVFNTDIRDGDGCNYTVAGVLRLWAMTWNPSITIEKNSDGKVTSITNPAGNVAHEIECKDSTIQFQDTLGVGSNNNKYRTHIVEGTFSGINLVTEEEFKSLSLGRFIMFCLDKNGNVVMLGQPNGITAIADGMNYNSGASEDDEMGWTANWQGIQSREVEILESVNVIPGFSETLSFQ